MVRKSAASAISLDANATPDHAPEPPPVAYGVPAAAKAIGIGASHMWAMLAADEVKAVKLGRRTLIPRAELEALIARLHVRKGGGI